MTTMKRWVGLVAAVAYVATIFGANWALTRYGAVPVWPGLRAPAGVYFAGLAFTLRDGVQETLGRTATIVAILAGGAVSAVVSPHFAVASATAFLLSEAADFAVYTPLRERGHWWLGVAASNIVGFTFDSVLFLWLAFHSLHFLPGQLVGKGWTTLVVIVPLGAARAAQARRRRAPVPAVT